MTPKRKHELNRWPSSKCPAVPRCLGDWATPGLPGGRTVFADSFFGSEEFRENLENKHFETAAFWHYGT
jgi:hypothetical protein